MLKQQMYTRQKSFPPLSRKLFFIHYKRGGKITASFSFYYTIETRFCCFSGKIEDKILKEVGNKCSFIASIAPKHRFRQLYIRLLPCCGPIFHID